ncbi:MAG: tetratricopeptide repeat protein [Candidatus Melainabacteria bacterium]|nr:tetratricopeptide repeat protein [Candidatus Melainabacteria bacterium]
MAKKKITEGVTSNDPKSKRWRSLFAAARMAYGVREFRQAESLLARALELASEIPEKTFAINTTEIGTAAVMIVEKRTKEGIGRLEKCISNLSNYGDSLHKELLAVALRFHAQALIDQGKERDAENELKKSLEVLKNLGSEARVQYAYTLCDLGSLYLKQGRHSEAGIHVLKGLQIVCEELGTESAEYTRADMIYQLCLPMSEETRMEIASDSVERMQYAFGYNHPNIERALRRYLQVLEERGDKAKIEETQKRFGVKTAAKH